MNMCEALATARETCKRLLMQAQEIVRDAGAKAKDAEEAAEEQQEHAYSHCLRCGKALRRPESRQRGYGDTCWESVRRMEKPADEPDEQQPAQ